MTAGEMRELMDVVYGQWPKDGSNPQNVKRLATLWSAALADMPYELAKRAVVKVLCTSPFFPKVSEIRSAALDLSQGQPMPWSEAYRLIRREQYNAKALPPLVAEAMIELGDSWNWRMETNQTARRAQFRQAYQEKVQQARERALLPPTLRKELEAANERGRLPDGGNLDQGGTGLLQSYPVAITEVLPEPSQPKRNDSGEILHWLPVPGCTVYVEPESIEAAKKLASDRRG